MREPVLGQPPSELRLYRRDTGIGFDRIGAFVTRFLVEPWYFKQVVPLLDQLIEETGTKVQEHCGALSRLLPKEFDQYVVNVTDKKGELFLQPKQVLEDIRHSDF